MSTRISSHKWARSMAFQAIGMECTKDWSTPCPRQFWFQVQILTQKSLKQERKHMGEEKYRNKSWNPKIKTMNFNSLSVSLLKLQYFLCSNAWTWLPKNGSLLPNCHVLTCSDQHKLNWCFWGSSPNYWERGYDWSSSGQVPASSPITYS